jgi:hypothetical protein
MAQLAAVSGVILLALSLRKFDGGGASLPATFCLLALCVLLLAAVLLSFATEWRSRLPLQPGPRPVRYIGILSASVYPEPPVALPMNFSKPHA